MKEYMKSIFIFRRDYRLNDNIGLLEALAKSIEVIPIFIFTPEQLVNNPYKSDNAVQFMIESLEDLDEQLKNKGSRLFYFFGKPNEVLTKVIKSANADAVFVNRDYTPYSKKRDESLEKVCEKNKATFHSYEDVLLHPVGSIRTGSDEIYTKFTPYWNKASKVKVVDIKTNKYDNYFSGRKKIVGEFKGNKAKFYKYNENLAVRGGRDNALKILNHIDAFKKYNEERNILSKQTTRLSAYIKFGCVSIREVYHKMKDKLGMKNDLIKQLHWREFYYNIGEFNTDILEKKKNFKKAYDKIPWITYDKATDKQKEQWKAWCEGKTGFASVDSAMRELVHTGFLHGRGRLIVSSFLIKNMFFHWKEGEKFFAQYLVDYDWIVNGGVGNWSWMAGSGADSTPYFRILSPIIQGKTKDPECEYIKQWLPELKDVPNEHVHEWYKYYHLYPNVNYPKPVLDYSSSAKKTIEKYKKALYS